MGNVSRDNSIIDAANLIVAREAIRFIKETDIPVVLESRQGGKIYAVKYSNYIGEYDDLNKAGNSTK